MRIFLVILGVALCVAAVVFLFVGQGVISLICGIGGIVLLLCTAGVDASDIFP